MRNLINKLLIYMSCTCFLLPSGVDATVIAISTLALSAASLCTALNNWKILTALLALGTIASILYPPLGVYMPLFLYDFGRLRTPGRIHTMLPAAMGYLPVLLWLPMPAVAYLLFVSAAALLLSEYTRTLDELQQKIHHLQDDSKEKALILKEKNRVLLEKQDSEIHIATLSERNRIAREIHDNVGHLLTRSILQTGALKVINRDTALKAPISELHDTLNTAMTNIRESVHDLHDESVDLPQALRDLVDKADFPDITLDYDIGEHVAKEIKYAFIAIVGEAINNIQRHSDATRAEISLREHPAFYQLHILDNGHDAHIDNTGIGLSNMRERVESLGGTIRFSTDRGFGIHISIWR